MGKDINEIARIINECFYYFNFIQQHARKLEPLVRSVKRATSNCGDSFKQQQKFYIKIQALSDKYYITCLKIKPFFTQLILDLSYILKISTFNNFNQNFTIGSFFRLKKGKKQKVENFKELVDFFRDAVCHPEHSKTMPSPRAFPIVPWVDPLPNPSLYSDKKDFCFQFAEGKIYLRADILKGLRGLKKQCLKSDIKNILKNFNWIKS